MKDDDDDDDDDDDEEFDTLCIFQFKFRSYRSHDSWVIESFSAKSLS